MNNLVLELKNIGQTYKQGADKLVVLDDANLAIKNSEMVALIGPSGSGKSTLLQIAGLLNNPQSGRVNFLGKDCSKLKEHERTLLRRSSIGFVYQVHHLLPEFSALENVMMPQLIAGKSRMLAAKKASELLELMGLGKRSSHRPSELSGGEQQRVAIARALANEPALILADEPTGNLDPHTGEQVFVALREILKKQNTAALIATHNLELAARMDRCLQMCDGKPIEKNKKLE